MPCWEGRIPRAHSANPAAPWPDNVRVHRTLYVGCNQGHGGSIYAHAHCVYESGTIERMACTPGRGRASGRTWLLHSTCRHARLDYHLSTALKFI